MFKVRENSKVVNKTVYISVGLKRDGLKEVLGIWLVTGLTIRKYPPAAIPVQLQAPFN
ncbi:transposase [Chitinophaga sp. Ak27]|uniref:transposase n=1 Tax=Chitinophaga sp. Ak27 TaxID=2726116 RepID=UPI003977AB84